MSAETIGTFRSCARGWVRAAGALLALASTPTLAASQASDLTEPETSRYEAGISASIFMDYPSARAEPFCEQTSAGVTVHASYWWRRFVAVEGALTVTGDVGGVQCAFADLIPIDFGVPYERQRYDETDDFGATNVAPTMALVVEPWRAAPISPRVRAGLGLMLDHGLRAWFVGGGIRYGFGWHALTMDVERWSFPLAFVNETLVYNMAGPPTILAAEPFEAKYTMYLIRVGWALDIS